MLVEQAGADLGARMAGVFERLFARGFPAVVMLGADSPTLPPRYLRAAVRALRSAAVDGVVGPSDDGGYYLIGLRASCRALFTGIAWSTERVLAPTRRRARRAGLRLRMLPAWYDVDTIEDLRRAVGRPAADAPGRDVHPTPARHPRLAGSGTLTGRSRVHSVVTSCKLAGATVGSAIMRGEEESA